MAQFDELLAQGHRAAPARGKINGADRHLRRQAQRVCGSRAVRHDDFSTLHRQRLDGLFHRRRAGAEPALHRTQIHAAPGTDQMPSFCKTRQSLVHPSAAAEVEKALCRQRRSFRKRLGVRQNLFGQTLHHHSPVRNICEFLTLFNGLKAFKLSPTVLRGSGRHEGSIERGKPSPAAEPRSRPTPSAGTPRNAPRARVRTDRP